MGTDYFRLHPWIGILSNLPVVAGVAAMLLLLLPLFRRRLAEQPVAWIGALFVVTRLVFLGLVVGTMGHVSLDLTTYFEAQGRAVLSGALPYRDFACSYAPLFPYLMAPAVMTPWPTLAIFVTFIAFDLATVVAVAKGADDRDQAMRAAWLYTAAPISWYFLVRYGQDEALAAALLAWAAVLLRNGGGRSAGFVLGLGFALTKFTFGLAMPPFALAARSRRQLALGLGPPILIVFGVALLAGLPVWRPLFGESVELGFGPSLWRLPVLFTPLVLGRWAGLVLLLGLAVAWWWCAKLPKPRRLVPGLVVTGCVFLLLSPKVLPMYLTPFGPAVAWWLAGRADRGDLMLVGLLNLLLGTWWYVDAGGVQGMFGPLVQALAVAVTAAVPVLLALLIARVVRTEPRETA
ncbi:MAG TPA: glycosyltransferase 87 family protein [Candidatus Eisenbacteria bacterium]